MHVCLVLFTTYFVSIVTKQNCGSHSEFKKRWTLLFLTWLRDEMFANPARTSK